MKLLIIGSKKRKTTDIALVESAKKYFVKVLYVPVTQVRIEATEGGVAPFFKHINLLKFDAVLLRIPKEHRDFGCTLAKIFEKNRKYMPVGDKAVLLGSSEFLVPVYSGLADCGLKTPLTYFASSKEAVKQNLENFRYPVTIRPPFETNGVMKVDSKESALGVLDTMGKLNQPILIQEDLAGADVMDIFVGWNKIYALRNKKPFKLAESDKKTLLQAAKAFGTEICRMSGVINRNGLIIRGISTSPKLMIFEEKFERNIIDEVLCELREQADKFFRKNFLQLELEPLKLPTVLK